LAGSGIAAAIKAALLERMVAHATVGVRRLAGGCRAPLVRYGRFLANPNVTVAALLDGWGNQTARAATSRHVLAIQDTNEVHFRTTERRRRGLGEVGHGNIHGLLVHAMLALDAATGSGLGLVGALRQAQEGVDALRAGDGDAQPAGLGRQGGGTLARHRRACQGRAGRGDDGDSDCRSRERPRCRPSTSSGGYRSSRPPGPITFKHGLEYFRALATGWELRNVCIP
jgi:hypothetical protein